MFNLISDVASGIVSGGISKLVLGNDKGAKSENVSTDATKTPKSSGTFDEILKKFLPADSTANVSEEELFAAAAAERIQKLKGSEGLEKYQAALDASKLECTTASGYVPMEAATINALKKLVADGTLSQEEGDRLYTESFQAAQLDANSEALFDGRGEDNDPTVAVAKMSEVMEKIKGYVERIAVTPLATENLKSLAAAEATGANSIGTSSPNLFSGFGSAGMASPAASGISGSESVVPNGTYVDGSEGFLFKPVTVNEKKLAVLTAQSWTGNVAGIRLLDSFGNLIEEGRLQKEGIAETGREKYIFSKQGGDYPKNLSVEVAFLDGAIKSYAIADPSKRYD